MLYIWTILHSAETKKRLLTHALAHWLADPDKSGQAVHSGSFAPALASLIFNSPCRSTTANALANGTFRATDTAKCR